MFIDYITLLLINMVAGHALLAGFVLKGIDEQDQRKWVPGFAATGLVAFVFGAHMTTTWPVIGPFNSAFGEMSVLLGILFIGAAASMAARLSLISLGVYAFFAGLAAILLGVRILDLQLTKAPLLSGIGFVLSGLGGVFAAPTLAWLGHRRSFRLLATAALVMAALIWALTGYMAYWGHMESFQNWIPSSMRQGAVANQG